MTRNEILSFVEKIYSDSPCIILTGSQTKNLIIKPPNDVDIIVISPIFSVISSRMLTNGNLTIDFTLMPLCDIENSMENERYDGREVLFTMIKNGIVLKDTLNIFDDLDTLLNTLCFSGNIVAFENYSFTLDQLNRIKKEFKKDTDEKSKFFRSIEFAELISRAEYFKLSGRVDGEKRKAMVLKENSPDLVNDLMNLTKGVLNNAVNFSETLNFLNNYLLTPYQVNYQVRPQGGFFIIDLF